MQGVILFSFWARDLRVTTSLTREPSVGSVTDLPISRVPGNFPGLFSSSYLFQARPRLNYSQALKASPSLPILGQLQITLSRLVSLNLPSQVWKGRRRKRSLDASFCGEGTLEQRVTPTSSSGEAGSLESSSTVVSLSIAAETVRYAMSSGKYSARPRIQNRRFAANLLTLRPNDPSVNDHCDDFSHGHAAMRRSACGSWDRDDPCGLTASGSQEYDR